MKLALFFLFAALIGLFSLWAEVPSSSGRVVRAIEKTLPLYGTLKTKNGFTYVDLSDAYIHKLFRFIGEASFVKTPYFGNKDLVGAHITVIMPYEAKAHNITNIYECGEEITFTPTHCEIVHPPSLKGVDAVYIISLEAPRLGAIREKYGLPKSRYPFHITIAFRYKKTCLSYQRLRSIKKTEGIPLLTETLASSPHLLVKSPVIPANSLFHRNQKQHR